MHQHSPAVVRLQLHLPDEQLVLFDPEIANREQILQQANIRKTSLTEFFVACQRYPTARDLTYPDMPARFVWDAGKKEWKPREKGTAIGRVYFAGPAAGERYYLRMLLYAVKGPRSWEDLRTVDGILSASFKAACTARGLLETDEEFNICLMEAGHKGSHRLYGSVKVDTLYLYRY